MKDNTKNQMLMGQDISFLRLMTMMSASDGSTGSIGRLRVPTSYINLPNKRYLTLINFISVKTDPIRGN